LHGIFEKNILTFFAMSWFSDLHFDIFSTQLKYYELHMPEAYIASIKEEFFKTYNKILFFCRKHIEIMTLWNTCLAQIQQMWSSPPRATVEDTCRANCTNFKIAWTDLKTDMYKECLVYMEQCMSMDLIYDIAWVANLCSGDGERFSHKFDLIIIKACIRIKNSRFVPPPPPSQYVDVSNIDTDSSSNLSSNISPGKGKRTRSIDAPLEGVGKFVRWCSSKRNIGIMKVIGQTCDEVYFDKTLCPARHIYVGWEMQYTREPTSQFAKTLTFPNHKRAKAH